MAKKKQIILITDGDHCAKEAIETAVRNVGARCISRTAGNPTPIHAEKIIDLIMQANGNPIIVMVDDEGNKNMGIGEKIIYKLSNHPNIDVLGIIAVASNMEDVEGVRPDFSIDSFGNIINGAVDKDGCPTNQRFLYGDTVDIIKECRPPLIIGIGDVGKMKGKDDKKIGAPIITKALKEIINKSTIQDN